MVAFAGFRIPTLLFALVAPILLLAAGAYEIAGDANPSAVEGLLIATIVLAALAFFPLLFMTGFVDPWIWIQAGAVIVPAAVHLAYHQRGYSNALWSCDVADIILGTLLVIGGLGYLPFALRQTANATAGVLGF